MRRCPPNSRLINTRLKATKELIDTVSSNLIKCNQIFIAYLRLKMSLNYYEFIVWSFNVLHFSIIFSCISIFFLNNIEIGRYSYVNTKNVIVTRAEHYYYVFIWKQPHRRYIIAYTKETDTDTYSRFTYIDSITHINIISKNLINSLNEFKLLNFFNDMGDRWAADDLAKVGNDRCPWLFLSKQQIRRQILSLTNELLSGAVFLGLLSCRTAVSKLTTAGLRGNVGFKTSSIII